MKIPFPSRLAVSHKIRNAYMAECLKRTHLQRLVPSESGWLSIVCYGPSLRSTWEGIKGPILTVSGAHNFLIERGVIPDYHVDCDPRPHKLEFITPPHMGVKYLMASCCDPQTWDILFGYDVKFWHMHNGPETEEWIKKNDPWATAVAGGSTVGLRAIHIGGLLGFRKFNIYGMDGNFEGDEFRAGPSGAPPQKVVDYKIGGRIFKTTTLMVNALLELKRTLAVYPIEIKLHGDGMYAAEFDWMAKCSSAQTSSRVDSLIHRKLPRYKAEGLAD